MVRSVPGRSVPGRSVPAGAKIGAVLAFSSSLQTGFDPAASFTYDIPKCDYYYALTDSDCFELRIPQEYDGTPDLRCRLPEPLPPGDLCLGDEGNRGPYSYYDPAGKWAPQVPKRPKEGGEAHRPDLELVKRRVALWREILGGRSGTRVPTCKLAPDQVYCYGKRGPFKP